MSRRRAATFTSARSEGRGHRAPHGDPRGAVVCVRQCAASAVRQSVLLYMFVIWTASKCSGTGTAIIVWGDQVGRFGRSGSRSSRCGAGAAGAGRCGCGVRGDGVCFEKYTPVVGWGPVGVLKHEKL